MADSSTPSPDAQVRQLYEEAESRTAEAFEQFVSKPSFGVLLARSAENVAAVARIGSDFADLVLRNLRLAGRADITRLSRQLHRTEDKLERLLQETEALRDATSRPPSDRTPRAGSAPRSRGNGTNAPRPTGTAP